MSAPGSDSTRSRDLSEIRLFSDGPEERFASHPWQNGPDQTNDGQQMLEVARKENPSFTVGKKANWHRYSVHYMTQFYHR